MVLGGLERAGLPRVLERDDATETSARTERLLRPLRRRGRRAHAAAARHSGRRPRDHLLRADRRLHQTLQEREQARHVRLLALLPRRRRQRAGQYAASCVDDNANRISQITGGGYTTATVKSFNTEWNSSYSGPGGGTTDGLVSMDSHANARFILKSRQVAIRQEQRATRRRWMCSRTGRSRMCSVNTGRMPISYILQQGGTLPFGSVFGLLTFQGMRKAAFNAFKMLNYLGPEAPDVQRRRRRGRGRRHGDHLRGRR